MPKSLVIVESPAKANTINKILGKDYVVRSSMGHIVDLPGSKMGIDVEDDFKAQYVTIPRKKKAWKRYFSQLILIERARP